MVSTVLTCRDCGSENLIRHGRTENGHPRFRCRACGVTFSDSPERGHTQEFKERILAAYHERASMRGIDAGHRSRFQDQSQHLDQMANYGHRDPVNVARKKGATQPHKRDRCRSSGTRYGSGRDR